MGGLIKDPPASTRQVGAVGQAEPTKMHRHAARCRPTWGHPAIDAEAGGATIHPP